MRWYGTIILWLVYAGLIGWSCFRTSWGWWGLGIVLAALLWWVDRVLYVWWLKPFEQLSIQIQYWWQRGDWRAVGKLVYERGKEQTRLVLRSVGFAFLWPLLAIYVLTSTGSVTAAGMVMGLGLGLMGTILADWRDSQHLSKWFCWQIKRPVSEREVRVMAGIYLVVWMWINVSLLFR